MVAKAGEVAVGVTGRDESGGSRLRLWARWRNGFRGSVGYDRRNGNEPASIDRAGLAHGGLASCWQRRTAPASMRSYMLGIFLAAGLFAQGVLGASTNTCAVLEFEITDDQGLDFNWARMGLADLLQVELQQHNIATLDRDFVRAIAHEQRLAHDLSAAGNLALGQCLGVRCLVKGSLSSTGSKSIRLSVTVVSVPENQVLASATVDGAFPDDLSHLITRLASSIAPGLSGTPGDPVRSPEKRKRYQPSPETLVLFYKGLDLCAQGLPERAVGWFICVSEMDPHFTQSLAWERKAYQLAGFPQFAAVRAGGVTNAAVNGSMRRDAQPKSGIRTVAVLDPLLDGHAMPGALLAKARGLRANTEGALLSLSQVRLFHPTSLASVINELDLQQSDSFANQAQPAYDKWLEIDGLVFCSWHMTNQTPWVQLDILDPISGSVLASRKLSGRGSDLPDLRQVLPGLLADWAAGQATQENVSAAMPVGAAKGFPPHLREKFASKYAELGILLDGLRKGEDRHRQLYEAFPNLRREADAACVMNHIIDQAINSRDVAVRLDTFAWALAKSLVPADKLNRLGDLVVSNAPAGPEAAQVWLLRGQHAFGMHDWKVAADCFQKASAIHARIDTAELFPPFDFSVYQWVCANAIPNSLFYMAVNPAPVARYQEVPWSLFEPFGDRAATKAPGSLAARCVWHYRGTFAFEAGDWSNTVVYLERFLEGLTNQPSCAAYLAYGSDSANWMVTTHYMTAFAALNLGDMQKARQHGSAIQYWRDRGNLARGNRLGIIPLLAVMPELSGRIEQPLISHRVFSRKSREELISDLLARVENSGSAAGDARLPVDCGPSVMQLFADFQRKEATADQLESVRRQALQLVDLMASAWKPSEAGVCMTGSLANVAFAVELLGLVRDIAHAVYPRRVVAEQGGGRYNVCITYATLPNGAITNGVTAELHAMAMRASAAYRAARGLPALDADLRVPAAQLLAYHQEALAILAAAGLSPDAKREYDVFLRPPRLAIAMLPGVLTRCGLPAEQCEQLFLAAVAQEQQPSSRALLEMQSDLGHRFLAERRHDKAMEWYQRAIQTGGMERLTFGQRVDVYRCAAVAAQSAEASALRKEYGEVVWGGSPAETNDTHAMAWYTAGRACQEQREADAALFCYQLARRSAADKNGWASASYHAAKLLEQAERTEEAAVLWKEIIKELPREKIMLYMEWEPGRSSGYPDKMLEEQGRRFMAAFRSGQIRQRFQLEAASAQGVTGVVRRVNPYKVMPAPASGAQRPREIARLPPVDPRLAQALTNLVALADSASWSATSGWVNLPYAKRDAVAAQLTKEFGHDVVPAILTMVLDTSRNHYKPQLGGEANMTPWAVEAMLDRAVTKEDAPFLLAACTNHYWLMKMAARLDPEGTTEVVRQAWMANLEQPLFVRELFAARLQALYPLVLAYVSVKGKNHHAAIFELARVVDAEKNNEELKAAFRDALGDCLRRMWRASDTYELARISQIALRQGVPEVLALLADSLPAAQCLAQVRPYMDLPVNNDEAIEMLLANRFTWQWDADRKRFRLPASGDAAK